MLVYLLLRKEWIEREKGCEADSLGRRLCPSAPKPPGSDYCDQCPVRLLEQAESSWEAQVISAAQSTLDDIAMGLTVQRDSLPYDEYLAMQVIAEERRKWQEEAEEYSKVEESMQKAREQRPFTKVDT